MFGNTKAKSSIRSTLRWDLLPTWIKFCTVLYFISSTFGILFTTYSLFNEGAIHIDMFHLKSTGIKNIGELSLILASIKLLVAYGYIFQKDWAMKVGITDALISILICVTVMIFTSIQEILIGQIIILSIYWRKIKSLQQNWENIKM
jgi:hypothetical protein